MEPSFKSDLNEYISQCKVRLEKVLQELHWTEAATLKDYNTNSIACSSRHALKNPCSTIKSTFPDSCATNNSVVLDTEKLKALLENNTLEAPGNFIELQANFTREQKLQLYKHAIDNTRKLENHLLDNEDEGEISLADILAQKKREEKRKKRRFRKSKPTHIEEVRCLVDLQMQSLEQFLGSKLQQVKEATLPRRNFEEEDYRNNIKYPEERTSKNYEGKRRHGSLSRETAGQIRSSNYELTSVRKMGLKSHDRVRRDRSISSGEDSHRERKKHSSKREYKSKEGRKHSKRSRSHSRKVSKRKKYRSNRRSRSHDKKASRESNAYEKYSNRRELASNSKYSKEDYKNYRNQSSSSSPKSYRKDYKVTRN